jgi:hypothetical protein
MGGRHGYRRPGALALAWCVCTRMGNEVQRMRRIVVSDPRASSREDGVQSLYDEFARPFDADLVGGGTTFSVETWQDSESVSLLKALPAW